VKSLSTMRAEPILSVDLDEKHLNFRIFLSRDQRGQQVVGKVPAFLNINVLWTFCFTGHCLFDDDRR
jgi:hypothetical protein